MLQNSTILLQLQQQALTVHPHLHHQLLQLLLEDLVVVLFHLFQNVDLLQFLPLKLPGAACTSNSQLIVCSTYGDWRAISSSPNLAGLLSIIKHRMSEIQLNYKKNNC